MSEDAYVIAGGDYDRAGLAAKGLKERLKRMGVDAAILRRLIIAAYEAETNVVIHAAKGTMRVVLSPEQVAVEVADEGPGIADIARAMEEGFSTAPARARELGFGAGMGLPNIRRNADTFTIESTPGRGTRVAFTVRLRPAKARGTARHSLRVSAEACRQCLHCLRACPTQALRVHGGRPAILEHLCIDCAACIGACQAGALGIDAPGGMRAPTAETVLVLPAALLAQFGPAIGPDRVLGALAAAGFRTVYVLESWERALRAAAREDARQRPHVRPVIVPVCPPAVNLVATRFPSLLTHLAPLLSPVEAAREELAGHDLVVVAACPGQVTALSARGQVASALPAQLSAAIGPFLAGGKASPEVEAPPEREDTAFTVSGAAHVAKAMEAAENGLLADVELLELHLCDQGCFGSPLMREDAFIARQRWLADPRAVHARARAVPRAVPVAARPGLRLDPDMRTAMAKLARMDELLRGLPGRDCGACGAPTCAALAEDVILGRAERRACPHLDVEPKA